MLQQRRKLLPGIIQWVFSGLLGLTLVMSPSALAQTAEDALRFSQRHPSVSAEMSGMSVRGFGGVGVYGALHSNPAGLGYVQRSLFSASLNFHNNEDVVSSGSRGFSGSARSTTISNTELSALSYVHKFRTRQGSMVFGLSLGEVQSFEREMRFSGFNNVSTISTSFLPYDDEYRLDTDGGLDELNDLPFAAFNGGIIEFFPDLLEDGQYPFLEAAIPGTKIEQEGSVRDAGKLYEGAFGIAVEATNNLMVGVSVNLVFGEYNFDSQFREIDSNDENGLQDYNVLQDNGNLLEGFDQLMYTQRLGSELVGFNLRAGLSAQATPFLRLGATVETPTWMYIEENYGASYTTWFDDGGLLAYGDGADDVGTGFFEYELRTPWRLGVGFDAELGTLRLLGDVEVVSWDQMEFSAPSDLTFRDVNEDIEDRYGTVVNTNLGAEADFGGFILRGGIASRPDPIERNPVTSRGEQLSRDRIFYSGGFSVNLSSRLRMDMAWQRVRSDDTWFAYPEDASGPRQDHVLQFDEEITRDLFILEFIYKL